MKCALFFPLSQTQVVAWMRGLGVHVGPSHVPPRGSTRALADLRAADLASQLRSSELPVAVAAVAGSPSSVTIAGTGHRSSVVDGSTVAHSTNAAESAGPPDLSNPLFNGVALSELAAAISSKRPTAESRTDVLLVKSKGGHGNTNKKQHTYNSNSSSSHSLASASGVPPSSSSSSVSEFRQQQRFVLRGTALTVRTMAQAVQNVNLAIGVFKSRREMAPSRHWHHPSSLINWKAQAVAAAAGLSSVAAGQNAVEFHALDHGGVASPARSDNGGGGGNGASATEQAAVRDRAIVDEMLALAHV